MGNHRKSPPTDFVLCTLAIVPIYVKPNEKSHIISQMLFGETAVVLERKNKQWYRIKTDYDEVVAWVDIRQLSFITEKQFAELSREFGVALDVCQVLMNHHTPYPILIGSSLPKYDGLNFKTNTATHIYNGLGSVFNQMSFTPDMIEKIARRFINAPYLFGGRSIFGLDSGSLVQLVYKCAGVKLPRYIPGIFQNIKEEVAFIESSLPGDIAFFVDKHEVVDHIGIILSNNEILHVNAKVVIDRLDHEGIYNVAIKRYTHKLKLIGRII